jgi:hypothetical protein
VPKQHFASSTFALIQTDSSKLLYGLLWLSVLVLILASFLAFSLRVSASWDPTLLPTAVCLNRGAIYIVTAVIGVATDFMVILLPIPTIWGLHLHMKQKLGLLGIFGVGST